MALITVILKQRPEDCSAYLDYWAGEDGLWEFEISVPKGERPTAVDVHFEFDDEEVTEP